MSRLDKPNVVVVGRFQIGKSTLINCLLDDRVAPTGKGVATTKIPTTYIYGQVPLVEVAKRHDDGSSTWHDSGFRLLDFLHAGKKWDGISGFRISLWKPLLQHINLIDTPGIDANKADTAHAMDSLDIAHFAFVLVESIPLCDAERRLFAEIQNRGIPFAVIVNCRNQNGLCWFPAHNGNIVKEISADLTSHGFEPAISTGGYKAWPCNLLWFWHASEHLFEEPKGMEYSEDIERYMQKHLRRRATSSLTFQQSNFEPIRLFFEQNHWLRILLRQIDALKCIPKNGHAI